MRYRVRVVPGARRELRALPEDRYPAVRDTITSLRTNPRPQGNERLKARPGYRVRVGDYRIIYDVDDAQGIVTILGVGHRREIYRD